MKSSRVFLVAAVLMVAALLTACQPITAEQMQSALAGQPTATGVAGEEATATEAAETETVGSGATATVTARSLRVRAEPSEGAEVVAGIREGEVYEVIGRSSDGLWLELAVPQSATGSGWVSANFVTVSGSITDTEVSVAPTPAPTEEATATEAPAEEPVATTAPTAPTEEPTVEATATEATATEAPAEEPVATAVPTEEPAAEATATEAPAEEPVATAEPTKEPAAEATATEEAAADATPAVTPPAPGFALVIAEGARLRVRAEPSTGAEIVGWVQPGEVVAVEELSADGLWVKLAGVPDTQNPNGGWVSAEFVVLGQ